MSLLAAVDLNGLLQFIFTLFTLAAFLLLYLIRNSAPNYFLSSDESDDTVLDWYSSSCSSSPSTTTTATICNRNSAWTTEGNMGDEGLVEEGCVVCGSLTTKQCSGCKIVKYCSQVCQKSHWESHKSKCKSLGSRTKLSSGSCNINNRARKILFPYEEFVELFNWNKPGFPPCGLLNCGNSCFANVVLQCLAYTKPLVAFLLEKGHRRECRRNDWCFLCEFQSHVERACQSSQPFSPINILSRLPNMGGNLGCGKQEDAHEFMRFAIDTMQSACLDKFGGEKALHPSSQETTLIQHIFGGHLQSQVICTKCKNISNQFENMMDLTVEIHGDAGSLEECLDQFTAKEWLHGDNMYKCDGCKDYTMAWKRLTVRCAPNILTIALKRFQSGRFGKLNKRVTFPETLDLSPYMSEGGDVMNIYRLYAVIVHLDMLNASFFGHYICYIKDFRGKWYRIDDCKVIGVDLDEVLSQGAYMLLYSRVCARSSSLYPVELKKESEQENVTGETEVILPSSMPPVSEEYIKDSCSPVASSLLSTSEEISDNLKDVNGSGLLSTSEEISDELEDVNGSGLLLSSEEISESKDVTVEEMTSSSKTDDADVRMDIEVEDPMDIDIHVEEGSQYHATDRSLSESVDTMLVRDNQNLTMPCSSSLVEDGDGGLRSDSCDVPIETDNHVETKVNLPVVSSVPCAASVSTSDKRDEKEAVDASSGARVKRVVGPVAAVGSTLNGRRSNARSTPFLSPGFLDKRQPLPLKKSTKQEDEQVATTSRDKPTSSKINGVIKPGFLLPK